jgi:hypothetical protein
MLKISSSRGAPPSNPRALAGLVLRDSELAYLLRSLIKPSLITLLPILLLPPLARRVEDRRPGQSGRGSGRSCG